MLPDLLSATLLKVGTNKRVALIILVFLTFLLLEAMGEVNRFIKSGSLVWNRFSVDTHTQIQTGNSSPEPANTRFAVQIILDFA